MKRLTRTYKQWLAQRQKRENRRRHKSDRSMSFGTFFSGAHAQLVKISGGKQVPNTLCLDRAYVETISFFHALRMRTLYPRPGGYQLPTGKRRGSRIRWIKNYYNFQDLRHVSPGAALILAAEYDRVAKLSGNPPAAIDLYKWDPYVVSIFRQLGFFELLNIEPPIDGPTDAPYVERMVAQTRADLSEGTSAIRSLFGKIGGSNLLRVALGSAVTDAVENVVGHAYPHDSPFAQFRVPYWWFLGAADPTDKRITLVIYDQGITIPASLPKKWPLQSITQHFATFFGLAFDPTDRQHDGAAIDAAMAIGATSTGESHRGKGLAKILEIIRQCPDGRLRIVSRCGECVYGAAGDRVVRFHPIPLMGTYVELEASFGD